MLSEAHFRGTRPDEDWSELLESPSEALVARALQLTRVCHGNRVTYSRKVFVPLTKLCRDVCHYCTFASTPARIGKVYMTADEVLAIARAGESAGCREALFTLGDKPEARYAVAREELAALGHGSTVSYLREMAELVLRETSLLPHLNPGILTLDDYHKLRPVSASMGVMLESASERLCSPGHAHHGSPDKLPSARLATLADAGRAGVPFTTGILIGIGETRTERLQALVAIRDLHRRYGHVQEVIIQNFRAKPGTRMARHAEPDLDDHCWTIAAARIVLGPEMTIQAPPNLHRLGDLGRLLEAGVNDWGGVSPVTADHVNPEAPWPELDALERATAAVGYQLTERLAIGPRFAQNPTRWADPEVAKRIRRTTDARGLPRIDGWCPGRGDVFPSERSAAVRTSSIATLLDRAEAGRRLDLSEIVALFEADGGDVARVGRFADDLRRARVGEAVTFVVNRNINYTNMCLYRCGFCAFAKGTDKALRGPAYRLDFAEIGRRTAEAWDRGATEVCLQGGIHPSYDGDTYLGVVDAVRRAARDVHVHAFSPLEIMHGAQSIGLSLADYLDRLRQAGLATLPGTAAEILDPEVRQVLCPDKLTGDEWIEVMRTAHRVGIRSTATIMFGHVDGYRHWAGHLDRIRELQEETGGFTEFVPLPFVHMEAPIWRRGQARSGPTYREAALMHAVARIVFDGRIENIQTSWVKMGRDGAAAMLAFGANDLGGTLMDESITRAAGGVNGQEMDADAMRALAESIGRPAEQRTTLYRRLGERVTA